MDRRSGTAESARAATQPAQRVACFDRHIEIGVVFQRIHDDRHDVDRSRSAQRPDGDLANLGTGMLGHTQQLFPPLGLQPLLVIAELDLFDDGFLHFANIQLSRFLKFGKQLVDGAGDLPFLEFAVFAFGDRRKILRQSA